MAYKPGMIFPVFLCCSISLLTDSLWWFQVHLEQELDFRDDE
jgi:hypothetical protein